MKWTACLALFRLGLVTSVALVLLTTNSTAVVVESQSSNTQVILNVTDLGYVIEDPPQGTKWGGMIVAEWRDADKGGLPDWTPTGTVDGSSSQAWLRDSGASLTTTTTVRTKAVTFNLEGDSNDGRARLLVDGKEVAVLDMWDIGHNRVLVIVRDLPNGTHALLVDDIGPTQQPGGTTADDDVAV
jgi:hypothetical protein